MTPAEQSMKAAADAYKLKHYGRTDVDGFGRALLTSQQIQEIRDTKNLTPSRTRMTQETKDRIIWQRGVV